MIEFYVGTQRSFQLREVFISSSAMHVCTHSSEYMLNHVTVELTYGPIGQGESAEWEEPASHFLNTKARPILTFHSPPTKHPPQHATKVADCVNS
jgi:hypothetical protein